MPYTPFVSLVVGGCCLSGHHCQQFGDLLPVAGGVGSDALAEAVALAAHASFRQ